VHARKHTAVTPFPGSNSIASICSAFDNQLFARSTLTEEEIGAMKLTFVKPHAQLRPYIESLWVFESSFGFPAADSSIAAPNGCPKLIIPYQNSLTSVADGAASVSHPGKLYFVGNRDSSTSLHSTARATGFIAVEFSPAGAFPIFGIPMQETSGRLWQTDQLLTKWSLKVQDALENHPNVGAKVQIVQDALLRLLRSNGVRNDVVEHCVQVLKSRDGLVSVQRLAQDTGYSRRHLNLLFRQNVGLAPKTLAGILRFQKYYRWWAERKPYEAIRDAMYDHYYDESHFHKEFKRMTGHAPGHFRRQITNEFGRRVTLR
jgi:AraC-like DNA-binding protein